MAPFRRVYAHILVAIVTFPLPYVLTHTDLRYRYPISTLLIFCALDGSFRLFIYMRARRDNRLSAPLSVKQVTRGISN